MTRFAWIIATLALLRTRLWAATPEHPGHVVLPNRIQATTTDEGKFMQAVAGKGQWSDGVPLPLFVRNANVNTVAGMPVITRDLSTGILTLPSAPVPPSSLEIYCNGVRQAWGRDFTLSGTVVTPGLDTTVGGVTYSPRAVFITALEIVADWQKG